MEHRGIGGQAPQHGPHGIGCRWIEAGVGQQAPHPLQAVREGRRSLQGEPGIEDHRALLPAAVEAVDRRLALGDLVALQGPQAGPGQRHRGPGHRLARGGDHLAIPGSGAPAPQAGGEPAIATARRPGQGPLGAAAGQGCADRLRQRLAKQALQGQQGGKQGRWIGLHRHGRGRILQFRHAGQGQQQAPAGLRQAGVGQDAAKGIDQFLLQQRIGAAGGPGQHRLAQQNLAGIPAAEGVAVVGQQVHQLGGGPADLQLHWR